jgi:hypothetical protein
MPQQRLRVRRSRGFRWRDLERLVVVVWRPHFVYHAHTRAATYKESTLLARCASSPLNNWLSHAAVSSYPLAAVWWGSQELRCSIHSFCNLAPLVWGVLPVGLFFCAVGFKTPYEPYLISALSQ